MTYWLTSLQVSPQAMCNESGSMYICSIWTCEYLQECARTTIYVRSCRIEKNLFGCMSKFSSKDKYVIIHYSPLPERTRLSLRTINRIQSGMLVRKCISWGKV